MTHRAIRTLTAAAILALAPSTVSAYDFSAGTSGQFPTTLYYEFNNDGTVAVSRGPNAYTATEIEVPATVTHDGTTYSVTGIGARAFYEAATLSVVLPEGIREIKSEAFSTAKVASINFPSSLRAIGASAFSGSKITAANMQEGVTTIGDNAFYSCANLQHATLPSTLTDLGKSAFFSSGLVAIDIPGSVKTINEGCFDYCTSLGTVTIGEGIETIAQYAFRGILAETVVLPSTLRTIGYRAFHEAKMRTVSGGDNLTTLGEEAFSDCRNLESYTMPDGVSSVGARCFDGCSAMTEISLSSHLTDLPEMVLGSCKQLVKVTFNSDIRTIGANAFWDCERLTSLELPASVESIGNGAFYNNGMTSFAFPPKMTAISANMFQDCHALTKIVIPDHITTIGQYAFAHCSSLADVTLPDGITEIPAGIFNECQALKAITIPQSVKEIGGSAFCDCTALTDITFPANLETVGASVFDGCKSLEEVVFPQYVKEFGNGIFDSCEMLRSVTFSPCAEVVTRCFTNCPALESVHMPRGVPPTAGVSGGIMPYPIIAEGNNVTLYVPTGSKDAYEADRYWNTFSAIVEEQVEGVQFGITAECAGDGNVTVNGAAASSYAPVMVAQGESAVIAFVPVNERFILTAATLNGSDITDGITDGAYTIASAETNYRVTATFSHRPLDVTIHSGINGIFTLSQPYGTAFRCHIAAAEGWEIESVTVNGADRTADLGVDGLLVIDNVTNDTDIYVAYKDNGSVHNVAAGYGAPRIYGAGDGIHIDGLDAGLRYRVHTADGRTVSDGISTGDSIVLSLPAAIYIVETPAATVKLAL